MTKIRNPKSKVPRARFGPRNPDKAPKHERNAVVIEISEVSSGKLLFSTRL